MTNDSDTMTTTDKLYAATSFGEFWEHYQDIHSHPRTRAVHALATASAIGMLALAVSRRSLKLALFAPILDYGIAQLSHRHDGVKTRPYRRPLWHARAEWRLFRSSLRDAGDYLYDHT